MRKRRWVLYKDFTTREYWIIEDAHSPIGDLERLGHCVGVYSSYDEAVVEARTRINTIVSRAKYNLERLENKTPTY